MRSRLPSGSAISKSGPHGLSSVSTPRLAGEPLRIPDAEVDQRVGPSVTGVFAQEERDVPSLDRGESRKTRFEAMDIEQLESESLIPSCGRGSVSDPQYRNHFFPRG